MFKKTLILILTFVMVVSATGCRKFFGNSSSALSDVTIIDNLLSDNVADNAISSDNFTNSSQRNGTTQNNLQSNQPTVDYSGKVPTFTNKDFEISAFWCPYDISEKGLKEYKNAGFNTLFTGNHSLSWTSENQFYLGSKRTLTALQNAKKVGLDVILNYNDWVATGIEGSDYYGNTPFSKYDVYGEYKDIIVGIHMVDEPKYEHLVQYSNQTLINDFKKVYPNAKYIVNLIPEYATASAYNFDTYDAMWDMYGKQIVSKFSQNRSASIDFYYFYKKDNGVRKTGIMKNYDTFANFAKKYNTSQTFIMQTAASPEEHNGLGEYEGNEFMTSLSEGDIRLQANMAMAFGADAMQYYCYTVPFVTKNNQRVYMYGYCILNPDNTQSPLYNYVKKVNSESQLMADVLLSYDWQEATGIEGKSNVVNVGEFYTMQSGKFKNTKHFGAAKGTHDIVISRFTSDKYGEGYMLVNFAQRETANTVDLQMRNCGALAVYGGAGYDGTPKVVNLDSQGMCQIDLKYGEGVFLVPLS